MCFAGAALQPYPVLAAEFAKRPAAQWLVCVCVLCVQVSAVRVTGPRYWHQLLAQQAAGRGRGPSLAALYSTRTLFVQRKAGALPYADDPSGKQTLPSALGSFSAAWCCVA